MAVERVHDGELNARVGAGDSAAFAAVYRQHVGEIRRLAVRLLHDAHLAEDVVQEVFLRYWHKATRYDASRGPLIAYLRVSCHHIAVERIRSDSARRLRESGEGRRTGFTAEEPSALVELRVAVNSLPEAERLPIMLAYFGGLTYAQVAATLRLPEGTIKSRIRAGLIRLRYLLADGGGPLCVPLLPPVERPRLVH